uniref:Mitotic spindle assembly checkpoint protein MAD1 n=1 Tax=Oncorhynchus tshawytscha TaxID=74940 RepID=A0AAZ3PIW8_ONCTS
TMDIEDDTTVFSTLKSFKSFISLPDTSRNQGEPAPVQSHILQNQYLQRLQLLEAAEKVQSKTQLIQLDQEKRQMEISHKRARIELEKNATLSARDFEREVDRNQDLLGRIRRLEEREAELMTTLCYLSLKYQEVSQRCQALQLASSTCSDHELKIKELERKLALHEQDVVIVKNMRSEVARVPDMDKELRQLREENVYLRETRENVILLKEETEGLRRKVERMEKMKEEMVNVELEKEKLSQKLQAWENLGQSTGLNIRTPEDLSREVIQIQQREIAVKQHNYTLTSSCRSVERSKADLQGELLSLRSKALEEQKKRETQESLVRRLQKRVLLLTKERDGMRAILESYDSELSSSDYTPQLSRRLREAEDVLTKTQNHNTEMEVWRRSVCVSVCLCLCLCLSVSLSVCVSVCLLKIEELEGERQRLEEQNNVLELRLERHNLQGDYNPVKTKVLHFSLNPTSMAKQQRVEEVEALRAEVECLRERLRSLQTGGAVPLAAAAGETSLSLPPSQEVLDLRKQMETAELKNQRLKEVFQRKIQEFRTVCYVLTGYQIDITTENQYRLTSVYAEHMDDSLLFKMGGPSSMQLMETDFSRTLREMVDLHLHHQKSIPAFLSAVTLDLFSRQTTV